MVLLTVTPAIQQALAELRACGQALSGDEADHNSANTTLADDYSIGQPISHDSIIRLHHHIDKLHQKKDVPMDTERRLSLLLKGSQVYIEPKKAKSEHTTEYKELMARLRHNEEARQYQHMTKPVFLPSKEQLRGQWSCPPLIHDINANGDAKEYEEDEVTFADINRQLALIINILVSIVACSVALWLAARHWTIPYRLMLSIGGSGLVGVAEVVVYAGYLRRIRDAKTKSRKKPEIKELMQSWIIQSKTAPVLAALEDHEDGDKAHEDLRKRILR